MSGLEALSLAANIIQVVDLSAKLIHGSKELHQSVSGITEENRSLDSVVNEMKQLTWKLEPQPNAQPNEDEKILGRLAKECRILSDQILDLLQRVAPVDPKSKRQVLYSTAKDMWSEREKRELETRLNNCRSQLALQLAYLTNEDHRSRFARLAKSADATIDIMNELHRKTDSLKNGIKISSLSDDAQAQLRGLLSTLQAATDVTKQAHIRESLAFPEMRGRFDLVSEAHEETFHWLVDGTRTEDTDTSNAHKVFSDWLTKGDGIFHISGKLGSGKSTLMKFLSENDITLQKLKKWAGNSKLVFASFFFWRPGSALQKSLSGLKRTLLHDILIECPELTPDLFQEYWGRLAGADRHNMNHVQIQDKDIQKAFSRLTSYQNFGESRRFCFFIDGLDEYLGTPQQDYRFMVNELKNWTQSSNQAVKLCVSSREDPVFENAFIHEKRLRLQDLTFKDLTRYTECQLDGLEVEVEKKELVQMVVEYSDGIFLWVVLVVKRLRDCMNVEHSLVALKRELQGLPRELEDLFIHLLENLPEAHPEVPYQVFKIINWLSSYESKNGFTLGGLTLLGFSFLDDYQVNKNFATADTFPHEKMDLEALNHHLSTARLRLQRYCKGLVKLGPAPWFARVDGEMISYSHRSVPEFLEKHQVGILQHLRGFHVGDAVSQLCLAEIRAMREIPVFEDEIDHTLLQLRYVMAGRMKWRMDAPPYGYLEFLDKVILGKKSSNEIDSAPDNELLLLTGISSIHTFKSFMIHICARYGFLDYVTWKLAQDPKIYENSLETMHLLHMLSERVPEELSIDTARQGLALIYELLQARETFRNTIAETNLDAAREMVYMTVFFSRLLTDTYFGSSLWLRNDVIVQEFRYLLEYMLNSCSLDPRLQWTILLDESKKELRSVHTMFDMKMIGKAFRNLYPEGSPLAKSLSHFKIRCQGLVTLQDLVDSWDLKNKEQIIALIAKQSTILAIAESYARSFWQIPDDATTLEIPHERPNCFRTADIASFTPRSDVKFNAEVQNDGTSHRNQAKFMTRIPEVWKAEDGEVKDEEEEVRMALEFGRWTIEAAKENLEPNLFPEIAKVYAQKRRIIIDKAKQLVEDELWKCKDKELLFAGINVHIVCSIINRTGYRDRKGIFESVLGFFARFDALQTGASETAIERAPTPNIGEKQVLALQQFPKPPPPTEAPSIQSTTISAASEEHETELEKLSLPPAQPSLEPPHRHISLARWQEQLLLVILSILIGIVLPSVWTAIRG